MLRKDARLRAWIRAVKQRRIQVEDAGKLSTSEFITVCLAVGAIERLPKPYSSIDDAWDRLNKSQREIVADMNATFQSAGWQSRRVYYA